MKLDDFVNTYIFKQVDFDGVYSSQCTDLFRQYCQDVLKISHTGSVEGAKDLYLNYDNLPLEKKYFTRFKKGVVTGDVAIWDSTPTNPYGHVAIVIGNMPGRDLLVFEQDGFKNNGAKLKVRTIDNLLGYLRFRG